MCNFSLIVFQLQIEYRLAYFLITARLQGSFAEIKNNIQLPNSSADGETEKDLCAIQNIIPDYSATRNELEHLPVLKIRSKILSDSPVAVVAALYFVHI